MKKKLPFKNMSVIVEEKPKNELIELYEKEF